MHSGGSVRFDQVEPITLRERMHKVADLPAPEWDALNVLVIAVLFAQIISLRMAATTTPAMCQLTLAQVTLG